MEAFPATSSGVTGIRDAGSNIPLDTLQLWRREILAGTRVGPPRQLLSGQSIAYGPGMPRCNRRAWQMYFVVAAEARRVGIPFGGHVEAETPIEASDSGARITDHMTAYDPHSVGGQTKRLFLYEANHLNRQGFAS